METPQETPLELRRRAQHYRYLRLNISDQRALDALEALADEYEALAMKVEANAGHPAARPRSTDDPHPHPRDAADRLARENADQQILKGAREAIRGSRALLAEGVDLDAQQTLVKSTPSSEKG